MMAHSLRIGPDAELDLHESFDWYESQLAGLGRRFLQTVSAEFERLSENPTVAPLIYQTVRQAILPKFPFAIYYIATDSEVEILAVFHASRDPAEWKRRT